MNKGYLVVPKRTRISDYKKAINIVKNNMLENTRCDGNKRIINTTITNAVIVFGSSVVEEVIDLVTVSSPEIMYENFVKLRMNRFRECLEMLFDVNLEDKMICNG